MTTSLWTFPERESKAWAVRYDEAAKRIDLLTRRLEKVLTNVKAL